MSFYKVNDGYVILVFLVVFGWFFELIFGHLVKFLVDRGRFTWLSMFG